MDPNGSRSLFYAVDTLKKIEAQERLAKSAKECKEFDLMFNERDIVV